MKRLSWLLLAALPYQAMASVEDPVAQPCYMCTNAEMYAKARSLGVGSHYVYQGSSETNIQGFHVTNEGGELVATHFVPAPWIRTQYNALMKLYDYTRGEFVDEWGTVGLQPPGSPHVMMEKPQSDSILWGHHVSDLNPRRMEARETVRRMLTRSIRFDYLRADTEHGRILRFESQLHGAAPLIAKLKILTSELGYVEFYFDYETRQWEYLNSRDWNWVIQEKADDFLYPDGSPRRLVYQRSLAPYFVQRAGWAGVQVIGTPPFGSSSVAYLCARIAGKIECRAE
ncbi:hypothetical protein [Stenotrophomonas bentonitica]